MVRYNKAFELSLYSRLHRKRTVISDAPDDFLALSNAISLAVGLKGGTNTLLQRVLSGVFAIESSEYSFALPP